VAKTDWLLRKMNNYPSSKTVLLIENKICDRNLKTLTNQKNQKEQKNITYFRLSEEIQTSETTEDCIYIEFLVNPQLSTDLIILYQLAVCSGIDNPLLFERRWIINLFLNF
jgi:hypothetical protein